MSRRGLAVLCVNLSCPSTGGRPRAANRNDRAVRHKDVPRRRRWRSFEQKPRFLLEAALGRAGCPDPAPNNRRSFEQKPRFLLEAALGRAGCPDPAPNNRRSFEQKPRFLLEA